MVGRGWLISRGWSMVCWSFMDWFVGFITWGTFVGYFNNVSRIPIGSVVFNYLGAAIREDNSVFTISGIAITSLIGTKVDSSVFISNGVFVLVFCWNISISRLFVCWGMVSWGWSVHRCWFVNWGWVVNWRWLVNWSWMVYWSGMCYWMAWSMSYSVAVTSGVSVLYGSMAFYFSIGNSQKGNKGYKGL